MFLGREATPQEVETHPTLNVQPTLTLNEVTRGLLKSHQCCSLSLAFFRPQLDVLTKNHTNKQKHPTVYLLTFMHVFHDGRLISEEEFSVFCLKIPNAVLNISYMLLAASI